MNKYDFFVIEEINTGEYVFSTVKHKVTDVQLDLIKLSKENHIAFKDVEELQNLYEEIRLEVYVNSKNKKHRNITINF